MATTSTTTTTTTKRVSGDLNNYISGHHHHRGIINNIPRPNDGGWRSSNSSCSCLGVLMVLLLLVVVQWRDATMVIFSTRPRGGAHEIWRWWRARLHDCHRYYRCHRLSVRISRRSYTAVKRPLFSGGGVTRACSLTDSLSPDPDCITNVISWIRTNQPIYKNIFFV